MAMNDITGAADSAPTVATLWYALWTRSRHEKVVRARLDELGVEAFLPMVVRWSRWKDRTKQVEFPLFPGYCFARFDVREAKPVLGCAGVVAIVGTPGVPSAISEEEIEAVRRLLDTGLSCDPCPFIKEGMPVVVTHGPLKGVPGRLVCKGPHAWLVISIEMIGRAVSVRIHAADVQAA
jgi:transcription antitermination factor NusG